MSFLKKIITSLLSKHHLKQKQLLCQAILHSFSYLNYSFYLQKAFEQFLFSLKIENKDIIHLACFLESQSLENLKIYWPHWQQIIDNYNSYASPQLNSEIDIFYIYEKKNKYEWRMCCLVLEDIKLYPIKEWIDFSEYNFFIENGKLYSKPV